MPFSKDGEVLVKRLFQLKWYNASSFVKEIPSKGLKRSINTEQDIAKTEGQARVTDVQTTVTVTLRFPLHQASDKWTSNETHTIMFVYANSVIFKTRRYNYTSNHEIPPTNST